MPLGSGGEAQTGVRIASTSDELLAAMVDKMSSRDALEPGEEAAVIAHGWRQ